MTEPTIRIALVDDQDMVREGITALLNSIDSFEVVLNATGGEDFLDRWQPDQTDVVILDIRMPGLNGIETLKRLREQQASIPVLMLTTFDEEELLLEASAAGSQGFLLKDVPIDQLREAIVTLHQGGTVLHPMPTRKMYDYLSSEQHYDSVHLTDREMSVLRLMAGGYSNKEIAASLFLAEGTIKNYVSDILDKLQTRDRTRAVLKAITMRLI